MARETGTVDLLDVTVDRRDDAEIVEVGRAKREDHIVQLRHRLLEQILHPKQALVGLITVAIPVAIAFALGMTVWISAVPGEFQRPRLIEGTSDERRDGVVDLGGNAAPLVLLHAHGSPQEVAKSLSLQCDLFAGRYGLADSSPNRTASARVSTTAAASASRPRVMRSWFGG